MLAAPSAIAQYSSSLSLSFSAPQQKNLEQPHLLRSNIMQVSILNFMKNNQQKLITNI
nr:MAG TPA: hypothetical protein [Caudoviricetes sp.]